MSFVLIVLFFLLCISIIIQLCLLNKCLLFVLLCVFLIVVFFLQCVSIIIQFPIADTPKSIADKYFVVYFISDQLRNSFNALVGYCLWFRVLPSIFDIKYNTPMYAIHHF